MKTKKQILAEIAILDKKITDARSKLFDTVTPEEYARIFDTVGAQIEALYSVIRG